MSQPAHEVTQLLVDWKNGDKTALTRLTPLVYAELRRLADYYMRKEGSGHTLQPTALVHEAYLRLVDQSLPDWKGHSHFFGVAAQLMRQILVDHARHRGAMKRDGGRKVMLTETIAVGQGHSADVMALDSGTRGFEKCARCQSTEPIELKYTGPDREGKKNAGENDKKNFDCP